MSVFVMATEQRERHTKSCLVCVSVEGETPCQHQQCFCVCVLTRGAHYGARISGAGLRSNPIMVDFDHGFYFTVDSRINVR